MILIFFSIYQIIQLGELVLKKILVQFIPKFLIRLLMLCLSNQPIFSINKQAYLFLIIKTFNNNVIFISKFRSHDNGRISKYFSR